MSSATDSLLIPGVLHTITPRALAAERSMLSTPSDALLDDYLELAGAGDVVCKDLGF